MRSSRTRPVTRATIAVVAVGAAIALTTARVPSAAAERIGDDSLTRGCAVLRTADASRVIELALDGTTLMPAATGKVRIERERKSRELELKIEADRLPPADSLGLEFLTYIVWSIDGRGVATSVGELRRESDGEARLEAVIPETDSVGILVTAEPHFAISAPSDLVVLRPRPANKAARLTEWTDAACRLVPRDRYRLGRTDEMLAMSLGMTTKKPLPDLVQALNAVEIASLSRADEFAPTRLAEARRAVLDAQRILRQRDDRKKAAQFARDAVIAAESARREASVRAEAQMELDDELMRARSLLSERDARVAELEREIERSTTAASRPAQAAPPLAPIIVQVPAVPAAPVIVQPQSGPVNGASLSPDAARLAEETTKLREERKRLARERQEMALARRTAEMRNQLAQEVRSAFVAEREALVEQRRAVDQQIAKLTSEQARLQAEREESARMATGQIAALGDERARVESERTALAADIGQAPAPRTMTDAGAAVMAAPAPIQPVTKTEPASDANFASLAAERAEVDRLTRELEQRQRALELEQKQRALDLEQKQRTLELERTRLEAERAYVQAERSLDAPSGVTVTDARAPEPQTTVVIEEPRKRGVWPFRRKQKAPDAAPVAVPQDDSVDREATDDSKDKRRWWRFGRRSSSSTTATPALSTNAETASLASDPQPEKKRGIWPFNRKNEPESRDAVELAPAGEPEPEKKRGIWPFNRKKGKDDPAGDAACERQLADENAAPDDPVPSGSFAEVARAPAVVETAPAMAAPVAATSTSTTPPAGAPVELAPAATVPHEARMLELRAQTELLAAERARLEAERLSLDRARSVQAETAARPVAPLHQAPTWRERVAGQFAVINTGSGLTVRLGELSFSSGSSTLQPGAREELSRLAGTLADVAQQVDILVEGHTDDTGGAETNLRLSQRRAEAVVAFFVSKGIDPNRLVARGYGESRPATSNATPHGRRENRRVEIVISDSAAS